MGKDDVSEGRVYGDKWDALMDALDVHSPVKELNKDFVYSNLSDKERRFARIHIKLVAQLDDILSWESNVKERRGKCKDITKEESRKLVEVRKELRANLLKDPYSMAFLSRSKNALPLMAILKDLLAVAGEEEGEENARKGIKDWLLRRSNG